MSLSQRQSLLFFSALRCSHLSSLAATSTYHARHTEKGDRTLILSHVHTQSMSSVGISNYHAKDTLTTRDAHSRTSMHTHTGLHTHRSQNCRRCDGETTPQSEETSETWHWDKMVQTLPPHSQNSAYLSHIVEGSTLTSEPCQPKLSVLQSHCWGCHADLWAMPAKTQCTPVTLLRVPHWALSHASQNSAYPSPTAEGSALSSEPCQLKLSVPQSQSRGFHAELWAKLAQTQGTSQVPL